MKKLIIIFTMLLVLTASAFGEGTVRQLDNGYSVLSSGVRIATFTIKSDAGSVPNTAFLSPTNIMGWYALSVEMYSATDDTFTVAITTNLGASIFSYTTDDATTGHLETISEVSPITSTPKIDVTNLANGEYCTVIVAFVR